MPKIINVLIERAGKDWQVEIHWDDGAITQGFAARLKDAIKYAANNHPAAL